MLLNNCLLNSSRFLRRQDFSDDLCILQFEFHAKSKISWSFDVELAIGDLNKYGMKQMTSDEPFWPTSMLWATLWLQVPILLKTNRTVPRRKSL